MFPIDRGTQNGIVYVTSRFKMFFGSSIIVGRHFQQDNNVFLLPFPFIQKRLELHHIRIKLYSIPLTLLLPLQNKSWHYCFWTYLIIIRSCGYHFGYCFHRLFTSVCVDGQDEEKIIYSTAVCQQRYAINLVNILHLKNVTNKNSPCL